MLPRDDGRAVLVEPLAAVTLTTGNLAAARRALNAAAARFNAARESFPAVLFAGMLGFGEADFSRLAESEKGVVDQTPKVAF